MQAPQLAEFGITREDLEWARRAERRLLFALLAASALSWSLYALLTTRLVYPLLLLRALVVGVSLIVVTSFVLAISGRGVLALFSARYRRVRDYARACRRLRARPRGTADPAVPGHG